MGQAIFVMSKDSHNLYSIATRAELDITDGGALERYVTELSIDTIVNCAAYTNVEGAEDNAENAYAINSDAVATIANVCNKHGIKLIHISTDYVFGGDSGRDTPYREDDTPSPINVYGASKASGEREALRAAGSIVIRTSWLYAPWGKNFMLTILRLSEGNEELRVVNDQHGTPTSALALAETIVNIIDNGSMDSMSGIYHYTDGGATTWYDFAREIVASVGIEGCHVVACSTSERKTKARRPAYSVLDTRRIAHIEGVRILPWRERLSEVMNLIKE